MDREGVEVELVSRVQLRAVLSGLAVAAGCFAVCMGLSWAIGLSMFQTTAEHARGLALGNVIWGAIALWISIFFGAFVAALVGRSPEGRTGVLHGLVVWGATAALLGCMLMLMFSSVASSLMRLGGTQLAAGAPVVTEQNIRALGHLAHATGMIVWVDWAGIVGGLITSILGGLSGARSEGRAPRRIGVRVPVSTTTPGVPQPA